MSNVYTTNPISLDTFSADYTFSTGAFYIKCIKLYSDDSATRVILEDHSGNPVIILGPGKTEFQYLNTHFADGLFLDASDCDHADGHAKVLIYI